MSPGLPRGSPVLGIGMSSFSKTANANIAPARFVKPDPASQGTVIQCGLNEAPWGISQPYTRRLALVGWDDGFAAVAGEVLNVIGPGDDEALLEIGEPVAHGQYLKSDGDGKGIPAIMDKDNIGAQALAAGDSAGLVIRVKPMRFDRAA